MNGMGIATNGVKCIPLLVIVRIRYCVDGGGGGGGGACADDCCCCVAIGTLRPAVSSVICNGLRGACILSIPSADNVDVTDSGSTSAGKRYFRENCLDT
ncbi:hypothetical protein DERF_009978 [Dermatophagoides farinae]|uniref:Uncharacterized protein n=1 Tax=Dermatophagoides farinae TaxID=6954 RepID=A0A922HXP2_DERFA|nr:hypothetical protein DERF_009978 [Dermatophagoides farinae]